MLHHNRASIADAGSSVRRPLVIGILLGAILIGTVAAVHYARLDLTLSHYDARAHLVVARRIVDSLTPGWRQLGAVWLPLPHLVNMPIVQWDWAYRTGYPSTAVSVLALAAGAASLGAFLLRRTGSPAAALAAPLLVVLNPNVLYLQSTPMTEPMLIGLSLAALFLADRWMVRGDTSSRMWAGLTIAALALTRYEGWLIAGALVAFAGHGRRQHGVRHALGLAPYLLAAIAAFLLLGRGSTGSWFVTSGFFEPDDASFRLIGATLERVYYGVVELGGPVLLVAGAAGVVVAAVEGLRGRMSTALPLTLFAAAILPLFAFFEGHPFRIRYMVPLVVACAAAAGVALGALPRRFQAMAAASLVFVTVWMRPPLDAQAPMVVEAQWETPFRHGREAVTTYLAGAWDGTPILASMGSLGHFMQESSRAGFRLVHYVHEGNGDLWAEARRAPRHYVHWVLIEERAEGGDELAARVRTTPQFLDGFERVAEGGGLALFRRRNNEGRDTPLDASRPDR